MQPSCRMDFVSLQRSVVWIHTSESDVFTKVVATISTHETVAAGHAGFYGHAVTWMTLLAGNGDRVSGYGILTRLQVCYALTNLEHNTSGFVA